MNRFALVRALLTAGTAAALLAPSIAYAATADMAADAADDTSAPSTKTSSSDGQIQEIVVTARKRGENLQSVPLAVTAFSGEQLATRGVVRFESLGQISPNVFMQRPADSPTSLYITIRGLSQSDITITQSSSVGVYLDGVYLPFSIGLRQSMFDIDRVEVLKGPQGTLYGKNTTGGAINLFTKQPGDSFNAYLQATYASYDTRTIEGAVTVPIAPGVASMRVAGYFNERDPLAHNAGGYALDNDNSKSLRGHLLLTPSPELSITLSGDVSRVRHGGGRETLLKVNTLGNAQGLPTTIITEGSAETFGLPAGLQAANLAATQAVLQGFVRDGKDHGGSPVSSTFDGHGFAGTVSYELGDITLKSITAERYIRRTEHIDTDATPYVVVAPVFSMNAHTFSQEANVGSSSKDFNWIVGGYYSRDRGDIENSTVAIKLLNPVNPSITAGTVRNSLKAGYAQATAKVVERVSLTGGYRYTSESKELISRNMRGGLCNIPPVQLDTPGICSAAFKDTFKGSSYLASVDYRPSDDLFLYLKTSRGFRGGGQNSTGTTVLGSFDEFKPEKATDYEFGFKSDLLDRRVRLNVAVYDIEYKNVQRIVIVQDPVNGSIANKTGNAASARIRGAEVELTARPVPELTLSASGGYTHARYLEYIDRGIDRSGDPFRVPRYQVNLSAAYALPTGFGTLTAQADYYWQSRVTQDAQGFDDASTTQRAYGLVNGRITAHFAGPDLDAALFATNLFDKRYLSVAVALDTQLGYNIGYLGEPRIVGVSLTKRFGS